MLHLGRGIQQDFFPVVAVDPFAGDAHLVAAPDEVSVSEVRHELFIDGGLVREDQDIEVLSSQKPVDTGHGAAAGELDIEFRMLCLECFDRLFRKAHRHTGREHFQVSHESLLTFRDGSRTR